IWIKSSRFIDVKGKIKRSTNILYLIMQRVYSQAISYGPSMIFVDGGYHQF
ncbi:unnamed protein product, partial [marine sediment metagenome]